MENNKKIGEQLNIDELEQVTGGVQCDENVRLPAFSEPSNINDTDAPACAEGLAPFFDFQ